MTSSTKINATFVAALATALMVGVFGCELSVAAQSRPRVVHVFVALADNRTQGIVPVAATLGNGEDPQRNLYWGSAYGVKTFFARSSDWKLLKTEPGSKAEILERCVFKHRRENVYLIADAYRGSQMKQAIIDFLQAAASGVTDNVDGEKGAAPVSAKPDLVTYVGHQGFMDFQLPYFPHKQDKDRRQAIVLACISKTYFDAPLRAADVEPLLWTTGLMAPEAYTLKSALDGWILNETDEQIRGRAAAAYHKYQRCGLRAARKLLVTGW